MHGQADAMPQGMTEKLAIAGPADHLAGGPIHSRQVIPAGWAQYPLLGSGTTGSAR